MIRFFVILLFVCGSLYAQTDWTRWGKAPVDYTIKPTGDISDEVPAPKRGSKFVAGLRSVYGFFISDLDGDNCAFYPSCSRFFVEATGETNFFNALFAFGDRFTRDTNFFKGRNHYPLLKNGKLYDPPINYTLRSSKINYIPGGSFVNN